MTIIIEIPLTAKLIINLLSLVFYRTMILDEEFENGKKLFVVDI